MYVFVQCTCECLYVWPCVYLINRLSVFSLYIHRYPSIHESIHLLRINSTHPLQTYLSLSLPNCCWSWNFPMNPGWNFRMSVCLLLCLSEFPERTRSYTSILLFAHLFYLGLQLVWDLVPRLACPWSLLVSPPTRPRSWPQQTLKPQHNRSKFSQTKVVHNI